MNQTEKRIPPGSFYLIVDELDDRRMKFRNHPHIAAERVTV
jgi:hypothetical protein